MDTAVIQSDLDILKDLSKEIEGFSISGNFPVEPETPVVEQAPEPSPKQAEEMPPLEGQIADIEFLLKEAETPAAPSFELAKQFDEFRSSITWETDDVKKKVDLALMAYEAELFETALAFIKDDRENKQHWPTSIEIIGGSLIKLGKYNEAIKTIGPMILLEEIPEKKKIEMRYLLASAYEGVGDFENALREIEHIMAANPDYRDVREVYELLGGKIEFERPVKPAAEAPGPEKIAAAVEEKMREDKLLEERMREERIREERMLEQRLHEERMREEKAREVPVLKPDMDPDIVMPTAIPEAGAVPKEDSYTTIIDEPLPKEKAPAKAFTEEQVEVREKGENIAFL
jgi:tetratricopeptide (TPR) repeat protein